MGLLCDVAGLWRLPQLVGLEHATELVLTGRTVDAAEAEGRRPRILRVPLLSPRLSSSR